MFEKVKKSLALHKERVWMQVHMDTANANRKEIICIKIEYIKSPRAEFSDLGSYISSSEEPKGNSCL